ncbi:MAG TPA: GNAT family N-acetyltransferase [Casimicrobiaceae bacterium]|nr:GNAT family N-acetyltransferase [Casimicrobiaceae bacterium]
MAITHYLRPLLAPASVAVCGASGRAGSFGRIVYENLLSGGFRGELFAVNPAHSRILGQPGFKSLAAIAHPVDLAVVCAPSAAVPAILAECEGRVGGAVVLSGAPTLSPPEYRRWRREIEARALAAKLPVLGPASFGVMRTASGLNASYSAEAALPGRLTLISQSGAVAAALLDFARTEHIGFASVVVLGCLTNVDFGELLDFALNDAETDAILLYIETLREARPFMSALRAAARTKPVVVLKADRHSPGERDSPTPDQVFTAALKRAGTLRVRSYMQLFAAARLLAVGRIPRGNRLAVVTNGRGPGLLAADCARDLGVELAEFGEATRAALTGLLPTSAVPTNPVDVGGEASPERFGGAVKAVLGDNGADAVLALHVASPAAPPTDTARAVAAAAAGADRPVLAAWLGSVDQVPARAALEASAIPDFYTPENAVEAFSIVAAYRRNQEWLLEAPPSQPEIEAPDLAAAARVRKAALVSPRPMLTAAQSGRLLQSFGIRLPRQARVASARQALARTGLGFRVAVYSDPVFGPVIALGAATTPGRGMALMLAPLSRRLACDLIAAARLPGLSAPVHLQDLLLRVSALACALPWVARLILSPVRIRAAGLSVEAARIEINHRAAATVDGYRHMAIHPYPAELETTVSLRDGTRLQVRPIRPEDADLERAFVAGLSEETRYRRFMQNLPQLTPQMLARFTQVDYDRELALIALGSVRRRERILGVVRYVANPDRESAEFAVVVSDAWQGRGLGRALMELLIARARARGYSQLVGNVLAVNAPMLGLAASLGFAHAMDPEDPEQIIVTLDLRRGAPRGSR